jgi:SAM-dependent methyltransferase
MNQWNVELYEDKHSYVWQYGSKLITILSPQPEERILDVGCGTGQLTAEIAATGAKVIGLDNSETAIAKSRINYPQIEFQIASGADFAFDQPFDAIFSNAALHWIKPPEAAAKCIYQALKPGGRFVAEFGGKGNVEQIIQALNTALGALGEPDYNPWYFPSIAEYSTILEQQAFKVTYASLFNRPTKLEGETGLANWLEMFAGDRLTKIASSSKTEIINQIESNLRSRLYHDGNWLADYQRIRVVAIK